MNSNIDKNKEEYENLNTIDQIRIQYEHLISNYETFIEKHNNSAGTRARKSLLELKKLSHELRKQISEEIANRKKSKTPGKKKSSPAKKTPSKNNKKNNKNKKNNNNNNEVEEEVEEVIEDNEE